MPLDTAQFDTIRSQALAQMQALLASDEPTVTVNDEEIAWAPWLAALERTVDWCDRKLAEHAPYEVASQARS